METGISSGPMSQSGSKASLLVFSNARRVLSQCNTLLRLLYLLNIKCLTWAGKRQRTGFQGWVSNSNSLLPSAMLHNITVYNSCHWMYDRSFCFISACFRLVTEEHGVDLNTKNYANMRRNACQARARNLRLFLQSSPSSDNGHSSVRCVNVPRYSPCLPQYLDSIFSPVRGSPSKSVQCHTPSLCERAHASTSAGGSKHQLPNIVHK